MAATYLLRFDDLCPTMNWTVWRQVEAALIEANIRPIVAVVPDNKDPELVMEAHRSIKEQNMFWEEVRGWQRRGWTIGLHGYQHRYVTQCAGIIGRNRYSEFAGLSPETQLAKLRSGLAIFAREGVRPDIWVAPAHSFDAHTLDALAQCGLLAVSDGYATRPHTDARGMFWVPQQLGRFRALPAGVWTVCLHHNQWGMDDVLRFRGELAQYGSRLADVSELARRYSGRSEKWLDRAATGLMSMARMAKSGVSA
jgi:peptidoglycan/xylan/chitin deacetylase (PgdA/CDA1 family)